MTGRPMSDSNKTEWWVVKSNDLYFKGARALKEEEEEMTWKKQ